MTFEEIKQVPFLPEQAYTHIAALYTHIKHMKRKLHYDDMRIAEHQDKGDLAMALKISASKQKRQQRIAETEKELARMVEIFGDMKND